MKNGSIKKYPDKEQMTHDQQCTMVSFSLPERENMVKVILKFMQKKVLDKIEEELFAAGSSMEKALHVNVYLHNIRDYDGMNEVYLGRFGDTHWPVQQSLAISESREIHWLKWTA